MPETNREEKQIIIEAKSAPYKFEPLYNKYFEQIFKFVYKRVENRDDCKEVTSVVFSKALTNIRSYKDQGFPFSSWLYRIAINEITQFHRERSKSRVISLNDKALNNLIADTGEQMKEQIELLKLSLLYLDESDLILIELRFFEERPFAEVAQIIGITENNAKVKTYRVLDKLKLIYKKLS